MPGDAVRIETGLAPHDRERLAAALGSGHLPATMHEDTLVIEDLALGRQVETWCKRLIWYNRDIHRIAKREGRPLAAYKTFDRVNLYVAVLSGLTQGTHAALMHEVIWWQPFPNANHRSAMAALLDELKLAPSEEEVRDITNPLFAKSKQLLDGSNKSLSDEEAKSRHLAVMEQLVEALQSIR